MPSVEVTGDFARLRGLVRNFAKLAGDKGAVHAIGEQLARTSETLVLEQFALQAAPTGAAWGKTLVRTGALAASFASKITARDTVVLTSSKRYAFPLAYGWGTGEHASRIFAAGLRASQALSEATDEKGRKRAKRKFSAAARRAKRFGKIRGRAPGRPMMPIGGSLGRWAGPLAAAAERAFHGMVKG